MSELTRFELDLIGGRRNPLYAQIVRFQRIEKAARELVDHESRPDRQAEFQSLELLIEFKRKMDALRQALGDGRE
jgi:hypothetical protein